MAFAGSDSVIEEHSDARKFVEIRCRLAAFCHPCCSPDHRTRLSSGLQRRHGLALGCAIARSGRRGGLVFLVQKQAFLDQLDERGSGSSGSGKQVTGSVKDSVGSVLGDTKLQAEGKLDKAEGRAQNTVGSVKDTLRGK